VAGASGLACVATSLIRMSVHSIDGLVGRVSPHAGVTHELLAGLGALSPTTGPHIVVASGHTTIRQLAAGYVTVAPATNYLASRGIRGVCVPVPYPQITSVARSNRNSLAHFPKKEEKASLLVHEAQGRKFRDD